MSRDAVEYSIYFGKVHQVRTLRGGVPDFVGRDPLQCCETYAVCGGFAKIEDDRRYCDEQSRLTVVRVAHEPTRSKCGRDEARPSLSFV